MDESSDRRLPTVSGQDREYMRRIGRMKHESHERARLEHLSLSLKERLVRSVAMTMANTGLPTWALRDDDRPERFYNRAKELGLYRP